MNIVEFRKKYPTDTLTLSSGKSFSYRYYKNSQAKTTVVLLTGGIGLSDLFYLHFERFTKDFSVITFSGLLGNLLAVSWRRLLPFIMQKWQRDWCFPIHALFLKLCMYSEIWFTHLFVLTYILIYSTFWLDIVNQINLSSWE